MDQPHHQCTNCTLARNFRATDLFTVALHWVGNVYMLLMCKWHYNSDDITTLGE